MNTAEKVAIILATIGALAVGVYIMMRKGLLSSGGTTSSSVTTSTPSGAGTGSPGSNPSQTPVLPPVIPPSSSTTSSTSSPGGNSTGSGAVTVQVSGTSATDPYMRDIALWSANPGGYISNGNWSAQPLVPSQVISNGGSVIFTLPSMPAHLWIAISSGMYYTWTVSVNVAGHVYTISGLNDQAQQVF